MLVLVLQVAAGCDLLVVRWLAAAAGQGPLRHASELMLLCRQDATGCCESVRGSTRLSTSLAPHLLLLSRLLRQAGAKHPAEVVLHKGQVGGGLLGSSLRVAGG